MSGNSDDNSSSTIVQDNTFQNAHGTVMVIAWMIFASTAILFARYGRSMRLGSRKKLFGESIWFQVHRLIACLTSIATLLGFFLILVETNGTWVGTDQGLQFVHSVLGGIIVCIALMQSWMALFRCHPDGSYRFIYNWLHRLFGCLAFLLSVPTLFTVTVYLDSNLTGMIIILSLWSAWIVLLVLIMEIIRLYLRRVTVENERKKHDNELTNFRSSGTLQSNVDDDDPLDEKTIFYNYVILFFFVFHLVVSIALAISLIVLIWE